MITQTPTNEFSLACEFTDIYPDNKVHKAYMGPTWVRQDPGGPHVGPMNLAIRVVDDEESEVKFVLGIGQWLRKRWHMMGKVFYLKKLI